MLELGMIVLSLMLLASLLCNLMFYRAIQNQDNVIEIHEQLETMNAKITAALREAVDPTVVTKYPKASHRLHRRRRTDKPATSSPNLNV